MKRTATVAVSAASKTAAMRAAREAAAKKKPAVKAAPPPVEEDEELEDEEEEVRLDEEVEEIEPEREGTDAPDDGPKSRYQKMYARTKKMRALGPAHAGAIMIGHVLKRLEKIQKSLQGGAATSPEAASAVHNLATAIGCLSTANTSLTTLPIGWKPPRTRRSSEPAARTPLSKGDLIDIRENVRSSYEDVLDPDQTIMLTVELCTPDGKKVRCRTQDNTLVILPRGHVCPAA